MQIAIDDPTDERIAVYLGLRDQAARQRREQAGGDMHGYFIAEGDLVIERAIEHGHNLNSVLISARRTRPLPESIGSATVFRAADDVLREITGRPELRDPIGCFARPAPIPLAPVLEAGSTFAVLEGLNNPNNLGVIMRNAAGLGIDAVLLDDTCGDPLYRRAIRASMGQVFSLPHVRLRSIEEGLAVLRSHNVETVALTPAGEQNIRDLERPEKVAILLGAEGPGLSEATLAAADHRVRIEMRRDVDSLNVANAAAIAFHWMG